MPMSSLPLMMDFTSDDGKTPLTVGLHLHLGGNKLKILSWTVNNE